MSDEIIREVGDISVKKDEGVIKAILRESTNSNAEKPVEGDTVNVHYCGRLEDGTEFDSSFSRNEPFSFKLGKGEVIKGWDIGVATMNVGEKCRLTIHSDYGYGDSGSGEKIPPKATLIFDVELLSISGEDVSEDHDNSVQKRTLSRGEGYEEPNDGSSVCLKDIDCQCYLTNGESALKSHFDVLEFIIGEAEEHSLPEGLECAIKRMLKGERARVDLKSNRLTGMKLSEPNVEKAVYTFTLESFEKAKESWQMDDKEKIDNAKTLKERGSKFCKNEKYKQAIRYYKKAVDIVRVDSYSGGDRETSSPTEPDEKSELYVQINNNLSLCYLKTGQYRDSLDCADKALEKQPKNEKALFRRGEAKLASGEWNEALKDFGRVLEINGSNSLAIARIRDVKQRMRDYRQHEKDVYAKMMKALGSGPSSSSPPQSTEPVSSSSSNAGETGTVGKEGCCSGKNDTNPEAGPGECCGKSSSGCCASKPSTSE